MIIVELVHTEMQKMIRALQMTPFLRDLPQLSLVSILDLLVERNYKSGDVVITKGQILDSFGIISKGNLQVVDEIRISRDNCSLLDRSLSTLKNANAYSKKFAQNRQNQSFHYGNKTIIDGKMEYNEHNIYKNLSCGQFFGGRCFFSQMDFLQK